MQLLILRTKYSSCNILQNSMYIWPQRRIVQASEPAEPLGVQASMRIMAGLFIVKVKKRC